MRSNLFFQLPILLLTFILFPSPLLPLSPAPLLLHTPLPTPHTLLSTPHNSSSPLLPLPPASCSPYVAPLLIYYGYTQYPSAHTIALTAVFNPDDILFDRTFYTVNGRSWVTDLIPGDATCPAQIQMFLVYTLATLNTGRPPFLYTQGHNLAAYTAFLRRTHQLCSEQAMQQTGCRLRHLYLPILRAEN